MNPSTPISRAELVRDLTTVHPLPKSKVKEMIDAYVAQEVRKEREQSDKRIVKIVKSELRHIVEGDEDGIVYSLETIGWRANKRLAHLSESEAAPLPKPKEES